MDKSESTAYNSTLHTNRKDTEYYSHYYDDAFEYARYDYFYRQLLEKWTEPRGRALDIGAFIGRFCDVLEHMGFEAFGIEPQESAAKFAKSKGRKVYKGSFPEDIPPEISGMKFDLTSMMESIYYLVDLKEGLMRANLTLKGGGFLLIQAHQGTAKYYSNAKNSFFKRYGDYVQGIPTLKSLKYCLEKTGFEIVDISALPIDYMKLMNKSSRFKGITTIAGRALNKAYELFMLGIDRADKLVILAKKQNEVENV